MKNDHNVYLMNSLNSQDICSLFTSQIFQSIIKCEDGVHIFTKIKNTDPWK